MKARMCIFFCITTIAWSGLGATGNAPKSAIKKKTATEKGGKTTKRPALQTVKGNDLSLSYVPSVLPEGRRSIRRERAILCAFSGELVSKVAVGYGRSLLPPGAYGLTIVYSKKTFQLLFRAKSGVGKESKKGGSIKKTQKKTKSASGKGPGDDALENKEGKTNKRKQDARDILLRVPLKFTDAKKDARQLEIELRPMAKGLKRRVFFRIGKSVLFCNLRVPDSVVEQSGKGKKTAKRSKPAKKARS